MSEPITHRIIEHLLTLLQEVQVAGGYYTNAGDSVYPDDREPDIENDQFPFIAINDAEGELEADVDLGDNSDATAMLVDIYAHDKMPNGIDPGLHARRLESDLKKAVCYAGHDRRLWDETTQAYLLLDNIRPVGRYLAIPKEAQQLVSVRVTFRAVYAEVDPNTY